MSKLTSLAYKFRISNTQIVWYIPTCYASTLLAHSYQPSLSNQDLKVHFFAFLVTIATVAMLFILSWMFSLNLKAKAWILISPLGYLFIGTIRGLFMFKVGEQLDLDTGLSILDRVMVSSGSTVFWLFLLAYFVNMHADYKTRFRSLFLKSIINRNARDGNKEVRSLLDEVQTGLRSIRFSEIGSLPDSETFQKVASDVRKQIDELIRPISHRLWISDSHEYPKARFRTLIVDGFKNLSYHPLVAATLNALISSLTLTTAMSAGEAFIRISIGFISVTLFGYSFRFVRRELKLKSHWYSLLEVFSLSYIPIWFADVTLSSDHISVEQPTTLSIYLVVPFIVTGLSIVTLIRSDQSFLFQSMESLASDNSYVDSRQAASYLHNSLQSELLAISKRLEMAAADPNSPDSRAALEQLGALINRSISEEFADFHSNSRERLNRVIENWKGILSIEIENSDAIFTLDDRSSVVVHLVEELASNLIKHGNSSTLRISCSVNDDQLVLEITPAFEISKPNSIGVGNSPWYEILSNSRAYMSKNGERYIRITL